MNRMINGIVCNIKLHVEHIIKKFSIIMKLKSRITHSNLYSGVASDFGVRKQIMNFVSAYMGFYSAFKEFL